jgi:hypothetical protein
MQCASGLTDLVDQMNKNNDEGNLWKNIPLIREIIHEFKDVAPFRSEAINPAYKNNEEHFPIAHHNFSRDYALHFAVGLPF